MPFTFSAGSFSFLKSSTISQSNIEQNNNNVDSVNKNNNNVNDYSNTSNNGLVIPLERSRSLDPPISLRNNRRNSNSSNNTSNIGNSIKNINRKWYKSIFLRIISPSRWNDDNNNNDNNIIKIINNNNNRLEYSKDDKNVDINNNHDESGCDDGPIMMKSRSMVVPNNEKNAFILHGNTHDFYVTTKHDINKISSQNHGPSSSSFDRNNSSVFEKCAQTPRHFAKETEVLGKVGRFTIVREREDFDTTYFDQCHCQQKPCRFSKTGCGTHPVLPPESLPQIFNVSSQYNLQAAALSQQNKHYSWSASKSRQSFYCNPTPFSNSSRYSLPSLQNNHNRICSTSNMVSKAPSAYNSNSCRGPLSQSASSPNLVHLNQRLKNEKNEKNENVNKNPAPRNINNISNNNNNNVRSNMNIIVCGNVTKHSSPPTNGITTSAVKKSKKPSLVNMKLMDSVIPPITTNSSSAISSISPSNPPTPTYPSKFSHYNPNEPHTTINSHSGRKFEVEWSSYSTTARSSSSTSSTSSTSSDPFPSPSSTISSVFSMASSPDKSVTSTLSRRCSTLSSKCGRKFEVTIISSNGNNLINTSPHSTIITSSVDESTVTNAETSKC